ncbi:hypothetical protein CO656_23395 [Sinorhizobium sp. FG01]|nr:MULTISPECIES: hypothetical protein [Sinorhizobium]PDT38040.1 hypothetical protein CO656_23395 [Sinorhizobium sp. FG01]
MYPPNDFHSPPLSSADLNLLQGILIAELDARHIDNDSEEANDLARRLIVLFQSGVRRADVLHEMIRVG